MRYLNTVYEKILKCTACFVPTFLWRRKVSSAWTPQCRSRIGRTGCFFLPFNLLSIWFATVIIQPHYFLGAPWKAVAYGTSRCFVPINSFLPWCRVLSFLGGSSSLYVGLVWIALLHSARSDIRMGGSLLMRVDVVRDWNLTRRTYRCPLSPFTSIPPVAYFLDDRPPLWAPVHGLRGDNCTCRVQGQRSCYSHHPCRRDRWV